MRFFGMCIMHDLTSLIRLDFEDQRSCWVTFFERAPRHIPTMESRHVNLSPRALSRSAREGSIRTQHVSATAVLHGRRPRFKPAHLTPHFFV
jgi:hypothetical protein